MSWASWSRFSRVRLAQARAQAPDLDVDVEASPVDLLDPYTGTTFDGGADDNMRRRLAGMLDRLK